MVKISPLKVDILKIYPYKIKQIIVNHKDALKKCLGLLKLLFLQSICYLTEVNILKVT